MNAVALGGYLRGLREGQGLTPSEVVVALKPLIGRNVDPTTVWKIENAKMMPGSDLLLSLLQVLRGNAIDAWGILRRDDLSEADGEQRGLAAAQGLTLTGDDLAVLAGLNGEPRRQLLAILAARRSELD